MVVVHIVPETVVKCLESFKSPIDCLVPCSQHHHRALVLAVPSMTWCNGFVVATITSVSHHPFKWQQHAFQLVPKDCQVMGGSRKWTTNPHNVSCLDAHSCLITDPGSVEFVATPPFFEVLCDLVSFVVDKEMSAINRHKTPLMSVAVESI